MNIEQAIQEKRQTEGLISKLINDFMDKSGLQVDDISLADYPKETKDGTRFAFADGFYIELSVRLP